MVDRTRLKNGKKARSALTLASNSAAGERHTESGTIQFGSEWPGVYIKGSHALAYADAVRGALTFVPNSAMKDGLTSLLNDLLGCEVSDRE